MRAVILALCVLPLGSRAFAQTRDLRNTDLPRGIAEQLQVTIDDPRTTRFTGNATIESSDTVNTSVAAFDGLLIIRGRVVGEVVVVDGDLAFEAGAAVTGSVTVVAGSLRGEDLATIRGTVTVYGEGFSVYHRGERMFGRRHAWREWDESRGDGRSDFRFGIAENYNRVEGLPLRFGPEIWTGGSAPLRVQANAIWRSAEGGLDTKDMGYVVSAEQFLPGRAVRIGASARSTVQAIEDWTYSDLEASLAAALFHDDLLDYFERTGWSAFVQVAPPRSPIDLRLEYRDEDHVTSPVRDPWTLFRGGHEWRAQPLAAEGDIRLLTGSAELDLRRGSEARTRGWIVRGAITHRLGGDLVVPTADPDVAPLRLDRPFTTGLVDVRRYQRIGWEGVLALRGVAAGSLEGETLPPQFQHALGGAGTLPGYASFQIDCSARSSLVVRGEVDDPFGELFHPRYGCDRIALFQAEYRGGFDLRFGGHDPRDDDDHGWRGWHVDATPNWTVFFDAAHAWSYRDGDPDAVSTGAFYDVGAGILLGGFGIYAAAPLTGEDRGLRFFVRLGPRF